MTAYFGRRYVLSASHRLHSDALSAEANRAVYGKCNNPYGHGHNYTVEVLVAGPVDPETGMVINMADLDRAMQIEVLDRFDHANLNLDPIFAHLVPTTENLSRAVFDLLQECVAPARLALVRVEETENNFFEFAGA
jgi:6-pyruvoyltetrahydropterin/6-carboxytetrahydropterin synthase